VLSEGARSGVRERTLWNGPRRGLRVWARWRVRLRAGCETFLRDAGTDARGLVRIADRWAGGARWQAAAGVECGCARRGGGGAGACEAVPVKAEKIRSIAAGPGGVSVRIAWARGCSRRSG
jgi:hypothetical protein